MMSYIIQIESYIQSKKKNMTESLQKLTQQLNLQIYEHQVSGKSPKFTDKSGKFIYKSYSEGQWRFFQYLSMCHIGHKSYQLSKFIPECLGVFTESEILHQQDSLKSDHEHSNLPNQILESVEKIAQQQISHLNAVSQRKQWIQHINSRTIYEKNQRFIKLKNLTYGFRYPNIMDIKLGIKDKKNKVSSSKKLQFNTTKSHGFRINGLSVRQFDISHKQGVQRFLSKYYCQKIGEQHLNKHLAFFMFNGRKIQVELLNHFIEKLKEIILGFLSFTDMKFKSSSIYLAYDAYDPSKYTINFIDFDQNYESPGVDESVERGLKGCLRHFIEIKNSINNIQQQLINKEIMYFYENHDVVPRQKIEQYEKRSNKKLYIEE